MKKDRNIVIGLEVIINQRNLTYKEVADAIKVHNTVISDWVYNRRKIPKMRVLQLAQLFEVPPSSIIAKYKVTYERIID